MGFENRDYYRGDGGGSGWGFDSIPQVCKYLIIANVVVFVLQIFITREPTVEELQSTWRDTMGQLEDLSDEESEELSEERFEELERLQKMGLLPRTSVLEEWFLLDTNKVVRQGQVWRMLTYAFCHDRMGVWHILFNMLFLYWFGKTLESMYGSEEFLLFYLASVVSAAVCHIGLDLFTHDSTPAIGASGGVMGVVMLYAIHFPRKQILLFMVFPIEIRWIVALYVIFDLHPVLLALAGTPAYSGVAHAAHLGGLAFGFVYWRYGLRLEKYWARLRQIRLPRWFGPRRHIHLYEPPQKAERDNLDTLVDKILEKIHEEGEESLTDVERDILGMASKKYAKRESDAGGSD